MKEISQTKDFKIRLWEALHDLTPVRDHGPEWLSVRCPFCGDSYKNLSSTHLYINIDMTKDLPVFFICHRCDTMGTFDPTVLRSLDINDLELNSNLVNYNKAARKNVPMELGIKNNDFKFKVPLPHENDDIALMNKEYIEKRIGVNFTFEELVKMKTIFRFSDFMHLNPEIQTLTVNKNKAIELDTKYVGFMSAKNEFINFRQVRKSNYKRYEKYSVINNLDNTRKFYTIPNKIDLLSTDTVTINIAEGVFDIFGVYKHVFDGEINNMIYTAVCGAGYGSVIKYFIKMGVMDNVNLNIFSDNDRNVHFYSKLLKDIKPWVNKIHIYYNTKEKDFGVPKDRIKIQKYKI